MKDEQKKINVSINEGDTFFSNEVSVNFNPMQFFLDFKCIAPRVDLRSKEGELHINIKHNVVTVDPYYAKQIFDLLKNSIANYEKEFGIIKKPKHIEKFEKKTKKQTKTKMGEEVPTYFG